MLDFTSRHLPSEPTAIAPDTSIIRELVRTTRGSLAHCTLLPGCVTQAVVHKTVEEIWYFTQGLGQVYRKQGDYEEVLDVYPQMSLTLPTGTQFQFRNTGHEPLCFIITTMPPWPGSGEAVPVANYWPKP